MKFLKWLILSACLMSLVCCGRIKAKSKSVLFDTIDNIHPLFDAAEPDTKYNKARFADFLKVSLTPDVKNIYCNANRIGIDASYQFAFNCSRQTAAHIIAANKLLPDTDKNYSVSIGDTLGWWSIDDIMKLPRYKSVDGDLYRIFWYDTTAFKGYFLDFDL